MWAKMAQIVWPSQRRTRLAASGAEWNFIDCLSLSARPIDGSRFQMFRGQGGPEEGRERPHRLNNDRSPMCNAHLNYNARNAEIADDGNPGLKRRYDNCTAKKLVGLRSIVPHSPPSSHKWRFRFGAAIWANGYSRPLPDCELWEGGA